MNGFVAGKRCCAALTALSVLSSSTLVWAQEDPKAKALGYYEQAVAAYQKGDYATAASLLERAFAIDPDRDLIYKYNRILALEKLGEFQKALDELDPYLEPMLSDPNGRFNDARELQQRLKAKNDEANLKKDPIKDPIKDPVKDPVKPTVEPSPPVLGYTLIGVGGALLAGGLLFGSGVLLGDAPANTAPQTEIDDYNSTLGTHKTIALVGLVGGLLVAGGGVALVLTHEDEAAATSEGGASAARTAPTTLRVTPAVGADGVGALLRLDF